MQINLWSSFCRIKSCVVSWIIYSRNWGISYFFAFKILEWNVKWICILIKKTSMVGTSQNNFYLQIFLNKIIFWLVDTYHPNSKQILLNSTSIQLSQEKVPLRKEWNYWSIMQIQWIKPWTVSSICRWEMLITSVRKLCNCSATWNNKYYRKLHKIKF